MNYTKNPGSAMLQVKAERPAWGYKCRGSFLDINPYPVTSYVAGGRPESFKSFGSNDLRQS